MFTFHLQKTECLVWTKGKIIFYFFTSLQPLSFKINNKKKKEKEKSSLWLLPVGYVNSHFILTRSG